MANNFYFVNLRKMYCYLGKTVIRQISFGPQNSTFIQHSNILEENSEKVFNRLKIFDVGNHNTT